jgi:hypothetical protein
LRCFGGQAIPARGKRRDLCLLDFFKLISARRQQIKVELEVFTAFDFISKSQIDRIESQFSDTKILIVIKPGDFPLTFKVLHDSRTHPIATTVKLQAN